MYGRVIILLFLKRRCGCNVEVTTSKGWTAVHVAAAAGHVGALRCLVKDLGADVEAQDKCGRTPLHCAAALGQQATAAVLAKEFKAEIEVRATHNGWTPVHYAAGTGQLEVLKCLVMELGANVQAMAKDGQTAFDIARGRSQDSCAQWLANFLVPAPADLQMVQPTVENSCTTKGQ